MRAESPGLGRYLGAILKKYGLSRSFTAEKVFVSQDTIDNWCTGRSSIRPHMLTVLIPFLKEQGVSDADLAAFVREELSDAGLDLSLMAQTFQEERWEVPVVAVISDARYTSQTIMLSGLWDHLGDKNRLDLYTVWDWSSWDNHKAVLRRLASRKPAVVVLISRTASLDPETLELRQDLLRQGVRIVACGAGGQEGETVIGLNERQLVAYAVRFLVGLGHRRIGALFVEGHPVQDERYAGFQEALNEHRLTQDQCPARWASVGLLEKYMLKSAEETSLPHIAAYLAQRDDITAILTPSEVAATAVLQTLRHEGKSCPTDVSVLAIKPSSWTDFVVTPPLTHINPPYYQIGALAAKAIMGYLDPTQASSIKIPEARLHDYVIVSKSDGTVGRAAATRRAASGLGGHRE